MTSKYSEFRKNKIATSSIIKQKINIQQVQQLNFLLDSIKISKTDSRRLSTKDQKSSLFLSDQKQQILLLEECQLNQTCDLTTNTNFDSLKHQSQAYQQRKINKSSHKRHFTQYKDNLDPFIPLQSRMSDIATTIPRKNTYKNSAQKMLLANGAPQKKVVLEEIKKIQSKLKKKDISKQKMDKILSIVLELNQLVDNI